MQKFGHPWSKFLLPWMEDELISKRDKVKDENIFQRFKQDKWISRLLYKKVKKDKKHPVKVYCAALWKLK